MSERLQKLIATAGYGSRRWAERLIEQGRVEVNNKTASIGDKAEITDKVKIDGRKIDLARYRRN
jgi:23S rRNA pseudouridine2605 synthase